MAGHTRQIGREMEQIARWFVRKRGFTLVEKNMYMRTGEVDIIAILEGSYIFIEVKSTRKHSEFYIENAISKKKKRRLYATILRWLDKMEAHDAHWRVDLIGVIQNGKGRTVVHYENILLH